MRIDFNTIHTYNLNNIVANLNLWFGVANLSKCFLNCFNVKSLFFELDERAKKRGKNSGLP